MGAFGSKQQTQAQVPAPVQYSKVNVFFFPDKGLPCRFYHFEGGCRRGNSCKFSHADSNLVHLLNFIRSARSRIDVCVFTITCNDIADALLYVHKKGVRIRIITDDDQATSQGSDAVELHKAGIQVKTDDSPYHMHHKFCVIDGKILINGSFNWTRQAVLHNQENIVIMNDQRVIKPFQSKFEQMWNTYKKIKI
eukprot:TRINITY_DN4955_c1_g1_i1.p3 TRINITY_DN4955_c1_g1~~TRINITY_DN4955_c1_g1_i1.p3  ORF type:complete len:194 (-),score=17.06 TRINITY_DN4955_c1_g1_i1:1492-2073(-)